MKKSLNHGLEGLRDDTVGIEGYKKTEVGVIPDDWIVKKLGDIGKFKNGINKGKEDFGFGYPFVNLLDIFGRSKLSNNWSFGLVNSTQQERKDYELKQGDVLFVRSSVKPEGVGLTAVVIEDLNDSVYSGFIIRFRDFNLLNLSYKEYCFYEENFRKRLIDNSTVSANTNINQDALKNLALAFPPTIAEQKAIAQSLSDVDALITECDRIITKKRNTKQSTMQQLLTGKKRLPGFSGEWVVKKVGEICDFIVPGRNKPRNFEGDIPWITTPDLEDGRSVFKSRLGLCISIDEAKNVGSKIVPTGSVIMSCAGELGIVALTKNEIVINQQLHAFIPSSIINGLFLLNAIKAQKKYLDGVATKTAIPYLNKDNCNSIPIPIPCLAEQKAITQILSDMDTEIEALEQKRDKYKAIKQGMMQELLTGKTRLKYDLNN